MRRLALVPILAVGLLLPTLAAALGLGEIEVHSALNQRLDARIPLRGVPEGRADDVIVALASERAFRDVGLRRPHALTRLHFEIRRRDDGGYYVHATSTEPIAEPFLSFLLEVDGPGGNLLREYTVLLDPPVFATEPSEREGETEEAAPESRGGDEGDMAAAEAAGELERDDAEAAMETAEPADTASAAEPEAEPTQETEAAAAAPRDGAQGRTEFGDTPVFLQVEREQARAERDAAEQATARQREAREEQQEDREAVAEAYDAGADDADAPSSGAAATADDDGMAAEYGPVERGDTLWSIAARMRQGDMTIQQLMLALLRYNPEAFADGNINRLKQGYVLRVPEEDEIRSVSAHQAIARVREQNTLWREWRRAARGEGEDTAVAERGADTGTTEPESAGEDTATAAGDDASRLSIVGAQEGGASSDQAASATTDGEAAAEELKLAREQLESARMEKAELESRVEDLEETVDKMERLITLRENQLAQLQEQLQRLQQDEAERAARAETPSDEGGDDEAVAASGASGDDGAAAAGGGDAGTGGSPEGGATGPDAATASAAADGGGATEQPAEPDAGAVATRTGGWLDSVTGVASGLTAAVSGTLAGLMGGAAPFAGPTSPGVLGGVALLLAALAGLLAVRRRRAAAEADADIEAMEDAALADAEATDEVDLGRMDAGSDLIAEELDSEASASSGRASAERSSALDEAFDLGDLEADAAAPAATAADAAEGDEPPKDDTVAEAEVYLAYGLHQQAEDLLRLALRESPGRADYHEKLLETLYAAGKKGEFVTEAGTFHGMVESTDSRMWQRVVAMGREIAPDDELFRDSAAPDVGPAELQKSRPATADIELDPGEGEAGAEEGDFARSLMLDEGPPGGAGGDADRGAGRESAASALEEEEGMGGEDLEFDLGDFEQLAGGDEETTADDERTPAGGGADEALDFDLAELGGAGAGAGHGGAESSGDEGDLELDISVGDTTGADETPARAAAGAEAGAADTGGVPDLDLGDLELDTGTGAAAGDDAGEYSLDMDDAAAGPPQNSALGAAAGGGEEDDEFDTMLDLARAYIDMGDPESASNALEEVIESGSEKQRSEARSLLETVQ